MKRRSITILIGIVVILIIVISGYLYYSSDNLLRSKQATNITANSGLSEGRKFDSQGNPVLETTKTEENKDTPTIVAQQNKTIPKDPLYFNLVANIPELLNTDTPMDQLAFKDYVANNTNRKNLCSYAFKASKIYSIVNNEKRVYETYKVKPMLNEEDCTKENNLSEYDLYQLYIATYTDYIRTNATELSEEILQNIEKAKAIKIKNYFNIIEDFPSFLSRTEIYSADKFREITLDNNNRKTYCLYYQSFIKVYNNFVTTPLPIISTEDCVKNFSADLAYDDYVSIYQYLTPEKYNFNLTTLERINKVKSYKLVLEQ